MAGIEPGPENKIAAGFFALAWLWKLLFIFLLGPFLLFPDRFPLWLVFTALALLLLPWIVSAVQTKRLLPATPINFLLLPLLLIFLPFSLWVSPLFWQASWPKTTSLLWSAAIFFAVVDAVPAELTAVQRQNRLRILALIYITLGVAMTAVGLLAIDNFTNRLPVLAMASILPTIFGQSINPNEVGGIITLYLPLVVAGSVGAWAIPGQRSLLRFALWLLLALFFGGVLLLTASFAALVGVAVGSALVLLLLNRRTRWMLALTGILMIISGIVIRLSPLFDQLALAIRMKWNSSIITREAIWSQALHSTQDFPLLGTGLGTFRYVAPVLYPLGDPTGDVSHAHNFYWQAALDFGWLGGLLFVTMWVVLVIYLLRSLRNAGQTEAETGIRLMIVGLLGSLAAHAVYSLFDALAPGARPAFALWYLFGLSVAVGAAAIPGRHQIRRWRVAATLVGLFLFVTMVWLLWPLQQASSVTARALLNQPQINETAAALAAQAADEQCRLNWHIGRLAHERNDLEARDAAWQRLLACSTQHTALIRTAAPADRGLAEAAVAKQPDDAAGYYWLAELMAGDNAQAAVVYYEQGLSLAPEDGVRWVELGGAREAVGDVVGALAAYDQACLLVDRGLNGCPRAGKLYMASGDYEMAAERYRRSMKQLPGWPPAERGLADALLALGQTAEAIPYLTNLAGKGDSKAQEQLQELMRGEQ